MTKERQGESHSSSKKKKSFVGAIIFAFFVGYFTTLAINCYLWNQNGYEQTMNTLNNKYNEQLTAIMYRSATYAVYYAAGLNLAEKWVGNICGFTEDKIKHTGIANL